MTEAVSPDSFDFNYLFRYRDLHGHNTLSQHREIIKQHGSCWWGWWKRPSEDPRTEVWQELAQATHANGSAFVGLFDSGNGTVHRAQVSEVVTPHLSPVGELNCEFPQERHLIPEYYRDGTQVLGWLRITVLSETPIPFFKRYSYRRAPPLRGYSDEQLKALTNKRVHSADELRSMDTTIWDVQVAQEEDPDEFWLLKSPAPLPPMSPTPIECNHDWILHITDPHFATAANRRQHVWRLESENDLQRPTMVEAITSALEATERKIGAVLVTGDLTFIGSPDEFDEAAKAMKSLTFGELGLTRDHLVVIPGNHDINWSRSQESSYCPDDRVNNAPEEARRNYIDFYTNLLHRKPRPTLSVCRRFAMPGGNLIDIAGLNSSSLEHGENFLSGMGRIYDEALEEAATTLGWQRDGTALRILALHHHLTSTEATEHPDEYSSGFGIAIDATRTLRRAAKLGVQLAIHGHKHRPFIWRVAAYSAVEEAAERSKLGTINIVGGGSAGSSSTDGASNYFNLFRRSASSVELELFQAKQSTTFERIARWSASLHNKGNSTRIKPWKRLTAE